MIAYVLDNKTLKTKDILEFEQYEFREDIEYSEKSSITVSRAPKIRDDDLVPVSYTHLRGVNSRLRIWRCSRMWPM